MRVYSGMAALLCAGMLLTEATMRPVDAAESAPTWHDSYREAFDLAEQQRKMLLVYFHGPVGNSRDACFEAEVLAHPCIANRLARFVCVRLPCDAQIRCGGQPVRLLEHPAFAALGGKAGVAVVDLVDAASPQHGEVVSGLPFTPSHALSARQVAVLLDLDRGTFDQRAAAYPSALRAAPKTGLQRLIDRTRAVLGARRRPTENRQGWYSDYQLASETARRQGKMLVAYFHESEATPNRCRFENESLAHAEVRARLAGYVCVRLPLDARVAVNGTPTRLLDDPRFEEMLGLPGLAIVDFAHRKAAYYGSVVSTFPMIDSHGYTPDRVLTILGLPAGTLTQRTMVYAVRVHPEQPASTSGAFNEYLAEEAERHSQYQASIHRQGHHFWETRFHRIGSQLPGGLSPIEVCAESWPGQRLLESAIECVRCWRTSSGHWRGVSNPHPEYAYDIKCGTNGIWYATGIFGG